MLNVVSQKFWLYYVTHLVKSIQSLTIDLRIHVESDGAMVALTTRYNVLS
jgi:hypothetical protein